ncbi:TolC family protein [Vampirovibrio sp.]|uniref:TolC family protein n=1 Tax=Vampirovibrio sp. TaxID=2717857 RepID=UPI0035944520
MTLGFSGLAAAADPLPPQVSPREEQQALAMPLDFFKSSPAKNQPESVKSVRLGVKNREMPELQNSPAMAEVLRLKWQPAPLYGKSDDLQKIGLDKVFKTTAAGNLSIMQAKTQVTEAETQARELLESNPLLLLNPIQLGLLKQAEAFQVQAAKSHVQVVQQQALLEGANRYLALTQAYLAKYLAFEAIEQGRNQLNLEERRFLSGESDRFGLTQTQMALIDRYQLYLNADAAYYTASLSLANHLGLSEDQALVPEEVSLRNEINKVPSLRLLPAQVTLAMAQKAALSRPDIQEFKFRKEALLKLVKASFGNDKRKHEAELAQLEMRGEEGLALVSVATRRAYAQFQTSQKTLELAQQRYELVLELVRQLEVSNKAGFSSAKDVLDGQKELAKANSALIESRLQSNLAQIQLAYEMGMLQEDLPSHPLTLNAL